MEQPQEGNFGAEGINNTGNIIALPIQIHRRIRSDYYSSKDVFTGGKTVREWLSTKSYREQMEFGLKIVQRAVDGNL